MEEFQYKEKVSFTKMNKMVGELNTNTKKLEDIEEGAQKNLPNTVTDPNYVHTDNNYSNEEKQKVQQNGEKLSELEDSMVIPDGYYQGMRAGIADAMRVRER